MTLHIELKALGSMTSQGLWIIGDTLGRELRALNVMNNFRLWLT